jgi:hypothetical protein
MALTYGMLSRWAFATAWFKAFRNHSSAKRMEWENGNLASSVRRADVRTLLQINSGNDGTA